MNGVEILASAEVVAESAFNWSLSVFHALWLVYQVGQEV